MTYKVILADPPWAYKVYSRDTGLGRSAESHYPTMTLDDLKALDVKAHADHNCVLFMWVTWPTIQDAFALAEAWGFTFKTCAFLWAKTNAKAMKRWTMVEDSTNWFMGMGFWTRANTEACLLFTIGKPRRRSNSVRQLIVSAIREHSQKPDEQYDLIERLVEGPYLELFSRKKREGWDCWGNEVVSDITLETVDHARS